ncbi:MAG TPA: hypothetical protein VEK09_00900, partial [Jatrophihabitantaceae bacterium]|nr:hypothetical protein [Jatrophihabitantaceae bacterium]
RTKVTTPRQVARTDGGRREALADLLPTATLRAVEGEQHNVAAEVLARVLREFASTEHAATEVQ